jgi:hypothetical protein
MVETPNRVMMAQYGCLDFHAKRDGGLKRSLAIKNNLSLGWSLAIKNNLSLGWTKSWFYCHVACLHSSEGGKSVYALHS